MSSWSGWCVLGTASVMMSFSYTDDRIRKTLRDMFTRREQTFRGDERGSALIEAAILTPLLIVLFVSVFECTAAASSGYFGLVFGTRNRTAVRDRYARSQFRSRPTRRCDRRSHHRDDAHVCGSCWGESNSCCSFTSGMP